MTTRSTASDDDQPQVIANRTQRRASVGFALFAVLEAWILFLDHTFGGYVFFAAGLLLFLFLAVRSWNSRIELDSDGLTSRSEVRPVTAELLALRSTRFAQVVVCDRDRSDAPKQFCLRIVPATSKRDPRHRRRIGNVSIHRARADPPSAGRLPARNERPWTHESGQCVLIDFGARSGVRVSPSDVTAKE
jgi:hypothetical protein